MNRYKTPNIFQLDGDPGSPPLAVVPPTDDQESDNQFLAKVTALDPRVIQTSYLEQVAASAASGDGVPGSPL